MNHQKILNTVVSIVSAYVSNNRIPMSELRYLIRNIYESFPGVSRDQRGLASQMIPLTSRQISETIQNDYLVSLIDGGRYKTLKRHLTAHGLTPEQYRARYALPADYPMVSASYSSARRRIAKEIRLGQKAV